jgi:mRNA-degrading endonuclease toxin of MazEF toxin-antitoxin module
MREPCSINLDRIQTIPKGRLGRPIAHISAEKFDEIREAIMFAFGYQE